jgi:5-methylcytosine-specific restriction protein B
LYDLGGKSKVRQLLEHPFIQAIAAAKGRTVNVTQTLWSTLQNHTIEDSKTVKSNLRSPPFVFDKTKDSIWQLVGEWRDACSEIVELVDRLKSGDQVTGTVKRYTFVTFHQSYGYEEFVEGLRPVLDVTNDSGQVRYEIRAGAFKELCRKARHSKDQYFAMVIDEINRGNISKIFGELITLIEPDKREGAKNALSVTLPYSGETFSVPANVDIVGTMNTADRSLALVDTALRRRFEFVPMMPDVRNVPGAPLHGLFVNIEGKSIDVRRMLECMNERIEALYDRDHTIGHAYLTALSEFPDGQDRFYALGGVFRNRILPLLEEYFFEDWQKIRFVLADNQKADGGEQRACFLTVTEDQEGVLGRLFGSDNGLDSFATKRRFALQESAFSDPDAFIGIYSFPVS